MGKIAAVPLLKNKSYVRMFLAYSISVYGDWFDMLAISILVAYQWNTSPILIGLIPVCYALPGILFGSLAGVLADRMKKVNLMIISDWSSALLTFALALSGHIYWVLPLLFIRSSLGLISAPAQQSLTRHIVDEDQLLKATSLNQIVNNSGKIVGPLLGALILTVLSPTICILINAISSLISGTILFSLRKIKENENVEMNEDGTGKLSFADSWIEGWRFVLKTRLIFNSILFSLIGIMCIQLVDFQFPVLLRSISMTDPTVFGLILSMTGIGSIITITWMNRFREIRYGWAIGGGMSLIGFGFAGVAFIHVGMSILIPVLFALLVGLGNGIWMVSYNFALQKESPKELVGRVFGITNSVMSAVFIFAPISGGILIQQFGAASVIQTVGFVVGGIGLIGILLEKWLWKKDEVPLHTKIEATMVPDETSV